VRAFAQSYLPLAVFILGLAGCSHGQSATKPPVPGNPVTLLAAAGVDKSQIIKRIPAAENEKPLEAYGRVIDQYGHPVVGAKVDGNALQNVGSASSRYDTNTTSTDADGKFEFTNLHGVNLGISIQKEGYETNNKGYQGAQGKLTPTNRDTYVMWKLQGAEPMVHQKFIAKLPCDGMEVNLDLIKGKPTTEAGDLTVSFLRNPVDIVPGKHFQWTLTLKVSGGGLLEIHDPYPYQAPTDDYEQIVTLGTGTDPANFQDSATKNFYYKSADGKYGRITIELQADFQPPPTFFRIEAYINPSGSRNLEFDGTKEIKAK